MIAPTERVDNLHGVLIIADEAPVRGDLRGNLFGFNVLDNMSDVPLKGFCLEVFLSKRAEGIHAEYNLAPFLTEHQGKRVQLAVKWTDRIDGAVACLWFKKGADVEIFVGF